MKKFMEVVKGLVLGVKSQCKCNGTCNGCKGKCHEESVTYTGSKETDDEEEKLHPAKEEDESPVVYTESNFEDEEGYKADEQLHHNSLLRFIIDTIISFGMIIVLLVGGAKLIKKITRK